MSSLADSPPAPQEEPSPRDGNDASMMAAREPGTREGASKVGSLRHEMFTLPTPPVSSGKQIDHVRLPAKMSTQPPTPPTPQPQPQPPQSSWPWPPPPLGLDEELMRFMMDDENYCSRCVDVAPARKALLGERKENRRAMDTEEQPLLPTSPEDDQLPSSLIDRAWFGVEPEGAPTGAPKSILNEAPKRAQILPLGIGMLVNRMSTDSNKTHDSGYESAFNVSHDQQISVPKITSGLAESLSDHFPIPRRVQCPRAVLHRSPSPAAASDGSSLEKETPPDASTDHMASVQASPETPETPVCSSDGDGEAGMETASDNGTSPRSPSPWQEVDDEDSRLRMAIALSQITSGMSEMLSSHGSTDVSRSSTRAASPETAPVDGSRAHAGGTGSSGSSQSTTSPETNNSGERPITGSCVRGVRRTHRRNDSNRGSDDGDGNEPNPKRRKPGTPEQPVARRRFACPYQKYDPVGSPFCCAKTSKNQEGGAETFSRVKSHVLRNHDPFIRCDICWKTCRTEEGVVQHKEKEDCISRPSPAKYWMTREQRDQVQRRRFMSGHVENWFSLFGILHPNVPADGPNGYKLKISPYFMDPDQTLPHPPCSPWPSHQPASSGPEQDSYPIPPRTRPSPTSNIPSQSLVGHGQDIQEGTIDFSSLLNIPDADFEMGEPLPFDGNNISFKGATYPSFDRLLGNNSQPELFSGPTAELLVDDPMGPPEPGQPSVEPGCTTNPRPDFLQLDNARLRNSNKQLAEEVRSIGKQCGEAQAQLRGFRNELRQLGNSLEELLYKPSVQNGDRQLMGRLFEISNTVTGISKSLGSGA